MYSACVKKKLVYLTIGLIQSSVTVSIFSLQTLLSVIRMDIFHKLNNKSRSCLCLNELINNDCHDSAEPSKSKDLEENKETFDKITNLDYNQDSLSKHGFLYIWTHYIKIPVRVHSMPSAL